MSRLNTFVLLPLVALSLGSAPASAASTTLVDPACDADGDGIVDNLSPDYAEGQQYGNLLNFYSVTMGSSPLHSAAPMEAMKLAAGLELSYIPQLGCAEQAVFGGYKTEPTNKSPVLPRLHVRFGLPGGAYVGVNGVPPVPAFGVRTGMIGGELGYGRVLADHIELGGRAALEFGHVVGDLAGPLPNQIDTADSFSDRLWSVEGMGGYRLSVDDVAITPYLGLGYTRVASSMHIGEDNVDVPGAMGEMQRLQYWGPHGELGASVGWGRLSGALEAYMVPLNWVDPGNPRFFLSPRLMFSYTFL